AHKRAQKGVSDIDLELRGRKSLVTGASKGLGFGCAQALAGEGAEVVVVSRDEDRIAGAAGKIGAKGHLAADLAQAADCERVVAEAVRVLGGLDIMVVNAGGPPPGTFESTAI